MKSYKESEFTRDDVFQDRGQIHICCFNIQNREKNIDINSNFFRGLSLFCGSWNQKLVGRMCIYRVKFDSFLSKPFPLSRNILSSYIHQFSPRLDRSNFPVLNQSWLAVRHSRMQKLSMLSHQRGLRRSLWNQIQPGSRSHPQQAPILLTLKSLKLGCVLENERLLLLPR